MKEERPIISKVPDLKFLFDHLSWEHKVGGRPPFKRQDGVTEITIATFRERDFTPAVRFFDHLKPTKTKVVTIYYYTDPEGDGIMLVTERAKPRESKNKKKGIREAKGYGDR